MINKEDFLRKKGLLSKENYGVLYCFKSDRSGVTDKWEVLKELLKRKRKLTLELRRGSTLDC